MTMFRDAFGYLMVIIGLVPIFLVMIVEKLVKKRNGKGIKKWLYISLQVFSIIWFVVFFLWSNFLDNIFI